MKKTYQTQQRKALIEFLTDNKEKQYTIQQIATELRTKFRIGESTLYRLMNSLVEEGVVSRLSVGNSRHFVYQIFSSTECHKHLHLKCADCGKLMHLGNEESKLMQKVLINFNDFDLDGSKTVLIGRCSECKRQEV